MLCRRLLPPGFLGALLITIGLPLGLVGGCDVLNPALTGTVGSSSVSALETPEGTILIAVLNTSSATAAARLNITKMDGSVLPLIIPVQPFDNDASSEDDWVVVSQDCDVESIQLIEVLAAGDTGGVQSFGSDLAPVTTSGLLYCGKVVAITILGSPPNLLVNIEVF